MKLVEEYCQRHNIKAAYAKHVHNGYVFYCSNSALHQPDDSVWHILRIHWKQEPLWHPGYYRFRHFSFRHDGYKQRNGNVLVLGLEKTVDWGEYEEYMRAWASEVKRVTSDRSEAIIAAWEASLFGWDGELSRHATDESFFQTIDPDLSVKDRVEAIMHFIHLLRPGNFYDFWRREINPMLDAHCDWIAKLKA